MDLHARDEAILVIEFSTSGAKKTKPRTNKRRECFHASHHIAKADSSGSWLGGAAFRVSVGANGGGQLHGL
jgi:hypothetical protein